MGDRLRVESVTGLAWNTHPPHAIEAIADDFEANDLYRMKSVFAATAEHCMDDL